MDPWVSAKALRTWGSVRMKAASALNILILSDGKMGDLMQCRGVAQEIERFAALKDEKSADHTSALQNGVVVTEAQISQSTLTKIPYARVPVSNADAHLYEAPLPDLIIASGRRTISHLRNFKRHGSQKGMMPPFIAFLKDPRIGTKYIDWLWTPKHDGAAKGDGRFSTLLSPHALSKSALDAARNSALTRFSDHPQPFTGIILGGNSKSVTWTSDTIHAFCDGLGALPKEGTALITASRRTPVELIAAVKALMNDRAHWLWSDEATDGPNPYAQILAVSDRLIVTGDSHNMVSEAVSTGAKVYVFRPPGLAPKLNRFLDGVEEQTYTADLSKGFETPEQQPSGKPADQTTDIARELIRHWSQTPPKTVHPRWG